MAVIEIPLSNKDPAFTFSTVLDNETYRFEFRWNGRIGVWIFDIFDASNVAVQTGNPFVTGFEFLTQNTEPNRPPGSLLAISTEVSEANATRFNIGSEVKFYYVEAGVSEAEIVEDSGAVPGDPPPGVAVEGGGVPYGAIIGIASNLSGAHKIPATGVVDSAGWMYCDGSSIPNGNLVSGTLPNLTDGRFIMGSTFAGSTGGANDLVLVEGQIPSHSHAASGLTVSENGDHVHDAGNYLTDAESNHDHSFSHTHTYSGTTLSEGAHTHPITDPGHTHFYDSHSIGQALVNQFNIIDNGGGAGAAGNGDSSSSTTGITVGAGTSHSHSYSGTTAVGSTSVTGGNGGHSHSVVGDSAEDGAHIHTISGATANAGSGDPFDNRPQYFTCQYIMRVN